MLASTRGHVKHQNVSMGWKPSLCQDRIVRNWLQASWDPVGGAYWVNWEPHARHTCAKESQGIFQKWEKEHTQMFIIPG